MVTFLSQRVMINCTDQRSCVAQDSLWNQDNVSQGSKVIIGCSCSMELWEMHYRGSGERAAWFPPHLQEVSGSPGEEVALLRGLDRRCSSRSPTLEPTSHGRPQVLQRGTLDRHQNAIQEDDQQWSCFPCSAQGDMLVTRGEEFNFPALSPHPLPFTQVTFVLHS